MSETYLAPLGEQKNTNLFSWVLGVTVCLVLSLGLLGALHRLLLKETCATQTPLVTLELSEKETNNTELHKRLLAMLKDIPQVQKVHTVPWNTLKKTLVPFVGAHKAETPYPLLVHIWGRGSPERLAERIRWRLSNVTDDIHLLVHRRAPITVRLWQGLSAFLISGTSVVTLVCCTLLLVLHMLGRLKSSTSMMALFTILGADGAYMRKHLFAQLRPVLLKGATLGGLLTLFSCWIIYMVLDGWQMERLFFAPDLLRFFLFFVVLVLTTLLITTKLVIGFAVWRTQRTPLKTA